MNPGCVVFDRYRLHEQVGSGGMGVVWRATDELLHQQVALKFVSFAALGDEQAHLTRDRILREARLAAQLRGHPNVIAIYDVLLNVIRTGLIRPPTCAEPLEPLLLRRLQINPTTRPDAATARDLLTQLTTQLTEPATQKHPRPKPTWRPSRRRIAIALGAVLAATSVMAAASLLTPATRGALPPTAANPASPAGVGLVDGRVENPQLSAYALASLVAGQSIGAWTVTQGNVDLVGPGFWSAAAGTQSVDLNGLVDGAVEQTVSTLPGRIYDVEFALAGNPDGPPDVKTGRALVNGQPAKDFSFDVTGKNRGNMGYRKVRFSFTATGPQTTVSFVSATGSAWGPVIDDVTITPAGTR